MFGMLTVIRCISLVEIIVSELIFCSKLKRKKHFILRFSLPFLIGLLYAIFFPPFTSDNFALSVVMGVLMFFPLWIISLFGLWFSFDEKIELLFLVGCGGYITQKIGSLVNSLFALIDPNLLNIAACKEITFYPFLLIFACDVASYIVCYFLFGKPFSNYNRAIINRKVVYPVITISLFVNLVFGLFYTNELIFDEKQIMQILNLYILNLFCCILVLVVISGILQKGSVEKELEHTKHVYNISRENYKNEKESIDIINRKCHDLKHRVMALKNNGADDFDDILKDIDIFDSTIHTGNEALDVVIQNKRLIADQNNIKLNLMLDADKLSIMKNTDIFVLFGNLLDNAINASKKLEDVNKRVIYIKIMVKSNMLLIGFENAFDGNVLFENGEYKTTNLNKEDHGFGIKSIKEIVKKYNGTIVMETDNNVFKTNISFILK